MSSGEVYLTLEGKEKLERELRELVDVRRPELARKLKEAIAEGDLKENADYHDAKEQQAMLESRIRDIESTLRNAQLVDDSANRGSVVSIGSSVSVVEDGTSDLETYRIVGGPEADPSKNKISNESPLGQALLGKKKGQKVKIQTPDGQLTFVIKDIK
jgi:transcription elongation factor GreA